MINGAFLSFEKFHGRKDIGSSRIRCDWVMKYWMEEFGTVEQYRQGKNYDFIVYQKVYWPMHAMAFQGIKILDVCDADWYDWEYPFVEMIQYMDAVTVSTKKLEEDLRVIIQGMVERGDLKREIPVVHIDDRIDPDAYEDKKKDHAEEIEKVVWFGYSHNLKALDPVVPFLESNHVNLTVISDKPFNKATQNFPWKIETVNRDIIENADLVINPRSDFGKWQYKSDNKTIAAWALGVPVARTVEEFEALRSKDAREAEAKKRLEEVEKNYHAKKSAIEYFKLFTDIYDLKLSKEGEEEGEQVPQPEDTLRAEPQT